MLFPICTIRREWRVGSYTTAYRRPPVLVSHPQAQQSSSRIADDDDLHNTLQPLLEPPGRLLGIVLVVAVEQERPLGARLASYPAADACLGLPDRDDITTHRPALGRERLLVVEVEVERERVRACGRQVDGRGAREDVLAASGGADEGSVHAVEGWKGKKGRTFA